MSADCATHQALLQRCELTLVPPARPANTCLHLQAYVRIIQLNVMGRAHELVLRAFAVLPQAGRSGVCPGVGSLSTRKYSGLNQYLLGSSSS